MPTDKENFSRLRESDSGAPAVLEFIPIPDKVKERFPEMIDWERKMRDQFTKFNVRNNPSV